MEVTAHDRTTMEGIVATASSAHGAVQGNPSDSASSVLTTICSMPLARKVPVLQNFGEFRIVH